MVRSFRCVLVVFALALGASCDTDEPLQAGVQNATVTITPNAARVDVFNVWDVADANGTGAPGLWCEFDGVKDVPSVPWHYAVNISVVRDGNTVQLTTAAAATFAHNIGAYDTDEGTNNVPGHSQFSLIHPRGACSDDVQILCNPDSTPPADGAMAVCEFNKAGICEAQSACSGDPATVCDPSNLGDTCPNRGAGFCTADGFCSRDGGVPCEPSCADLQKGSCTLDAEVTRTFQFSDPRRLSAANLELLQAESNVIYDACIGDPICEAAVAASVASEPPLLGLCPGREIDGEPGIDPGNPNDLNSDPTIFGLLLDKGDRVIVEARRSDEVPNHGITYHGDPLITARLTVDGVLLQPGEVQCGVPPCRLTSELGDPSPNISFSFTAR